MFARILASLFLLAAFCAPLWADIPPSKKGGCSLSDEPSLIWPALFVVAATMLALRTARRSARGRA